MLTRLILVLAVVFAPMIQPLALADSDDTNTVEPLLRPITTFSPLSNVQNDGSGQTAATRSWTERYELAQRDKAIGQVMFFGGLGSAAIGVLYAILDFSPDPPGPTDPPSTLPPDESADYLLYGLLIGGGAFGVFKGYDRWRGASEEIERLEGEREQSGLAVGPMLGARKGVLISYVF